MNQFDQSINPSFHRSVTPDTHILSFSCILFQPFHTTTRGTQVLPSPFKLKSLLFTGKPGDMTHTPPRSSAPRILGTALNLSIVSSQPRIDIVGCPDVGSRFRCRSQIITCPGGLRQGRSGFSSLTFEFK